MPNNTQKSKKKPNSVDEYIFVPLLLCIMLGMIIAAAYAFTEVLTSETTYQNYYPSQTPLAEYRIKTGTFLGCSLLLLVFQFIALKLKKRWVYLVLLILGVSLFFWLPKLLL